MPRHRTRETSQERNVRRMVREQDMTPEDWERKGRRRSEWTDQDWENENDWRRRNGMEPQDRP